jgi:hypothetical protein
VGHLTDHLDRLWSGQAVHRHLGKV